MMNRGGQSAAADRQLAAVGCGMRFRRLGIRVVGQILRPSGFCGHMDSSPRWAGLTAAAALADVRAMPARSPIGWAVIRA